MPKKNLDQTHVVGLIMDFGCAQMTQLVHSRAIRKSARYQCAHPMWRKVAAARAREQISRRWLSPLAWWGFGSRGAGLGEGAGAVSLPVLGWAIA